MLLTLMARALRRAGYSVAEFLAAEDALQQVHHPPDVLVTDQQLPGITGVELAGLWCSRWPQIQAIVCSGLPVDRPASTQSLAARIRTLQKPFSPDDLLAAVASAVESNRAL